MKLIGLHGKAGAGKDTVADHLVAKHGFVKYSFAKPLKEEVAAAFSVTPSELPWLEHRDNKERPILRLSLAYCLDTGFLDTVGPQGMTGPEYILWLNERRSWRWLCQQWGTNYRRAQDENYWLDRAGEFIQQHMTSPGVVVADVRFENEASQIRACAGQVWHVHRPGVKAVNAHVSEAGVAINVQDAMLGNTGTIEQLLQHVDAAMRVEADDRLVIA